MDSAYIGRLQGRLAHTVTVCSASGRPLPAPMSEGDPLCGEPLSYPWDVVRDDGVALCITLERAVYLDRAVVTVGEKTALTAAVLRDGEGNILSRTDAETGKTITERTMALTVDRETDTLSIALVSDFSDVEVLSVELYGMIGATPIFPTPQSAVYGERELPFSRFRSVAAKTADERRAAEILCEKYGEKTGITLQMTDGAADISLFTDPSVPANGYRLTVSEERTSVAASDLRGLIMGAESFLKLTTGTGVRTAEIEDAPFLPLRGVHLYLPALKKMDFAHRLVRDLISPMGYNLVIVEVATGMEYKSHPEINEAFRTAQEKIRAGLWPDFPHAAVAEGTVLSHEDVRAFVDDVRSFGIEVVPEVQSLGHVPYLTLAHPEIAEVEEKTGEDDIDTRAEDARPNRFYPHCYCPSNERSYEILFDILDEVIEVFRPREYVHMGHDEVYYMGLCPKCRTKPHAELFASDVNRIHAHLREKGYKMMIWSDMLQPVTKYRTPPAVDLIPKDVLCLDFIWYFHLEKDIEENLLEKGFKVAVGNLYSSHFPRYESRIRKSGMVGGQISMWVATNEGALAQEGKLYDIMMTAQMLWSERYTRHCRLAYDRLLRKEIPALRDAMRGTVSPSRRAGAVTERLYENASPTVLQDGAVLTVPVPDGHYNSLRFTHTMARPVTRLPWKPYDVVATYTLRYADGSEEEIPVTAGGNVGYVHRRQNEPLSHKLYRHNGYTTTYLCDSETTVAQDGTVNTDYLFEHPTSQEKALVSVTLKENAALRAGVLLRRIEGVRG